MRLATQDPHPIAIEWGDENTAIGIHIPDIPDAVTAGDTFEEAYRAAVEVAHLRLEELAEEGAEIPLPQPINKHRSNPDFAGYGWGMIEIDITPYLGATEKVNVTLPGAVVRKIDEHVKLHGIKSRSAFLADAALKAISAH